MSDTEIHGPTVYLPVLQKTELSPALTLLAEVRPAPAGVEYDMRAAEAKPIPACQPPEQVPPQFVIRFRRPFVLGAIPLGEQAQASLACSQVLAPDFECQLALDLRFKQVWKRSRR
jgi:hypothetical protein